MFSRVVVFRGSYFIKAIENVFPVFAEPDINTQGVGRILNSYANPRLRLGFGSNSPNLSCVCIRLCKHGKRTYINSFSNFSAAAGFLETWKSG